MEASNGIELDEFDKLFDSSLRFLIINYFFLLLPQVILFQFSLVYQPQRGLATSLGTFQDFQTLNFNQ